MQVIVHSDRPRITPEINGETVKRIMVVDDEEDILWMLQRNLTKGRHDVEIVAAKSGEDALALLLDMHVDLVITDINMPNVNGLDLLIEINNRFPGTGIIIMTAYPSNACENEAMMSGSLRFIEKPFNIKELSAIVEEVLLKSDEREDAKNILSPVDAMTILSENLSPPSLTLSSVEGKLNDQKISGTNAEMQHTPLIEELEMTDIQKILAEFIKIDGVHTACLVGRDGFLLDSLARTGIDAEMIGAIASLGFGSAESMGNQLGQGNLRMTMFEFANGPVMLAPVGDDAFLVIVADQDTNLGWIRISIKRNSKKIKEIASL